MKLQSARRADQGLTLPEVLVVIAMIAVLVIIITMTTGGVRDTARASISLSNLRQLSVAGHAVAGDLGDILPATTWASESRGTSEMYWWTPLIRNYLYPDSNGKVNGLFRDPASPEGRAFSSSEFRNQKWSEISYIPWADGSTDWGRQIRGIKRGALKDSSRQPYLSTVVMGSAIPAVMSKEHFTTKVIPSGAWRKGAILLVYCDGHATVVKKPVYSEIAPLMPQ